jgi:flagellar biosynthesis protein FliP
MHKSLLIMFGFLIVLGFVGYNFAFKTSKIIQKYLSLTKIKEHSNLYHIISSRNNLVWLKIIGFVILLFTLILFCVITFRFLRLER